MMRIDGEPIMLHVITDYTGVDERKLMAIYAESNSENAESFYPDMQDKALAVKRVEQDFLSYIKNEFFSRPGNTYYILEAENEWVSALRLYSVKPELYYLEALETRPECRGNGYASMLLYEVIGNLKGRGSFQLCDCVSKKNAASLGTHIKCGFQIVSEEGYDYLAGEADGRDYGMEYSYSVD